MEVLPKKYYCALKKESSAHLFGSAAALVRSFLIGLSSQIGSEGSKPIRTLEDYQMIFCNSTHARRLIKPRKKLFRADISSNTI